MWQLLPSVRSNERPRFALFFTLAAMVSLAQMVGLAGAEALFLTRLGVKLLPITFVIASLFTAVTSMAYALRVGRERNDRVFVELLLVSAAGVAVAGVGIESGN